MSRPPPQGLSAADQEALLEMRRRLWTGGLKGMAAGFIFGKVGFWIAEKMHRFHTFKLNRNHRFATPLVTAAMGGLVMSLTAGKNETHTLHYILAKTSSPRLTDYQEVVAKGRLDGEGRSWDELREEKAFKTDDIEKHKQEGEEADTKIYVPVAPPPSPPTWKT